MACYKSVYLVKFEDILELFKKHRLVLFGLSVSVYGLFTLRRYFLGRHCQSKVTLHGKTVIITGGNTGIGKETAIDLAKRGGRVVLACRDLTKGERAAADIKRISGNNNIQVRVVDLASLKSIQRFCTDVKKNEDKIDILINNAGVMACPHWESEDGYEMHFAVNHLGHFYLTMQLLDLLIKSAPSRIVNVSSQAHSFGNIYFDDINFEYNTYDPWKAFCQSKLANILVTKELHKKLQGSGVSVYSIHPGFVSTEHTRHSIIEMPFYKRIIFRYIFAPVIAKTPKQGAQTSIYCSVTEGLECHSGKYFCDCNHKEPSARAKDDNMATRLWELSEKMVNDKV